MRASGKIHLISILCVLVVIGAAITFKETAIFQYGMLQIEQKRIVPAMKIQSSDVPAFIQKLKSKQPVTIVAFGDSITWGYERDATSGKIRQIKKPYPSVLEQELRKKYGYNEITVINEGHPGWTSIQALEHVEERVLPFHPDLIISMFGINDARGHIKYTPNSKPILVTDYKENYRKLLKIFKEKGLDTVILSATTITSKKNNANDTQADYSNAIKTLAQEENIPYINGSEIPIEDNLSDGIHFKEDKYRLIAEKIMSDFFDAY